MGVLRLLFFVADDRYFVSHRLGLAKSAIATGYDVSVLTCSGPCAEIIKAAGIHLYTLPISRSGMNVAREILTFLRIVAVYARVRPDIVHHVAMKPVVYGSLAARLVGIESRVNALMGLGFVFSSSSFKARLLRPFVKTFLALALAGENARLVLQNADDVAFFEKERLIASTAIRLVRGSGVDPRAYSVTPENTSQTPLVVLPARLLKDKGVLEFVEAARLLKNKGIKARFALVGTPDLQNPSSCTQKQIDAWTTEGLVEHWGWREDMRAVFGESNIVCLPSYREGLPKALLEAAACGRAIVTSDAPGCREIVRHEENGWLVPVGDAPALAQTLTMALAAPEKRALYAAKGRALIEAVFADRYVFESMLNLYRELWA